MGRPCDCCGCNIFRISTSLNKVDFLPEYFDYIPLVSRYGIKKGNPGYGLVFEARDDYSTSPPQPIWVPSSQYVIPTFNEHPDVEQIHALLNNYFINPNWFFPIQYVYLLKNNDEKNYYIIKNNEDPEILEGNLPNTNNYDSWDSLLEHTKISGDEADLPGKVLKIGEQLLTPRIRKGFFWSFQFFIQHNIDPGLPNIKSPWFLENDNTGFLIEILDFDTLDVLDSFSIINRPPLESDYIDFSTNILDNGSPFSKDWSWIDSIFSFGETFLATRLIQTKNNYLLLENGQNKYSLSSVGRERFTIRFLYRELIEVLFSRGTKLTDDDISIPPVRETITSDFYQESDIRIKITPIDNDCIISDLHLVADYIPKYINEIGEEHYKKPEIVKKDKCREDKTCPTIFPFIPQKFDILDVECGDVEFDLNTAYAAWSCNTYLQTAYPHLQRTRESIIANEDGLDDDIDIIVTKRGYNSVTGESPPPPLNGSFYTEDEITLYSSIPLEEEGELYFTQEFIAKKGILDCSVNTSNNPDNEEYVDVFVNVLVRLESSNAGNPADYELDGIEDNVKSFPLFGGVFGGYYVFSENHYFNIPNFPGIGLLKSLGDIDHVYSFNYKLKIPFQAFGSNSVRSIWRENSSRHLQYKKTVPRWIKDNVPEIEFTESDLVSGFENRETTRIKYGSTNYRLEQRQETVSYSLFFPFTGIRDIKRLYFVAERFNIEETINVSNLLKFKIGPR